MLKYSMYSKNEYGTAKTKIKEISDGVVTSQGNGMEAKVNIVCNTTSYFDYIVNKLGSMSSVGARFLESYSITGCRAILMFELNSSVLGHDK